MSANAAKFTIDHGYRLLGCTTQDMNYQWKTPRAIKAQEKIKMQAKKAKGQNPRKLAPRVRTKGVCQM